MRRTHVTRNCPLALRAFSTSGDSAFGGQATAGPTLDVMKEKQAKPWWAQVNGLPPSLAARRDEERAATAGMTRAQRSEYHANRTRRWIAAYWWRAVVGLTLLTLLQLLALRHDYARDVTGIAAWLLAVQRLFFVGVLGSLWVRCAEARFLRE
jgi:hypothetical protein